MRWSQMGPGHPGVAVSPPAGDTMSRACTDLCDEPYPVRDPPATGSAGDPSDRMLLRVTATKPSCAVGRTEWPGDGLTGEQWHSGGSFFRPRGRRALPAGRGHRIHQPQGGGDSARATAAGQRRTPGAALRRDDHPTVEPGNRRRLPAGEADLRRDGAPSPGHRSAAPRAGRGQDQGTVHRRRGPLRLGRRPLDALSDHRYLDLAGARRHCLRRQQDSNVDERRRKLPGPWRGATSDHPRAGVGLGVRRRNRALPRHPAQPGAPRTGGERLQRRGYPAHRQRGGGLEDDRRRRLHRGGLRVSSGQQLAGKRGRQLRDRSASARLHEAGRHRHGDPGQQPPDRSGHRGTARVAPPLRRCRHPGSRRWTRPEPGARPSGVRRPRAEVRRGRLEHSAGGGRSGAKSAGRGLDDRCQHP